MVDCINRVSVPDEGTIAITLAVKNITDFSKERHILLFIPPARCIITIQGSQPDSFIIKLELQLNVRGPKLYLYIPQVD